jgi:hypothetical protein
MVNLSVINVPTTNRGFNHAKKTHAPELPQGLGGGGCRFPIEETVSLA